MLQSSGSAIPDAQCPRRPRGSPPGESERSPPAGAPCCGSSHPRARGVAGGKLLADLIADASLLVSRQGSDAPIPGLGNVSLPGALCGPHAATPSPLCRHLTVPCTRPFRGSGAKPTLQRRLTISGAGGTSNEMPSVKACHPQTDPVQVVSRCSTTRCAPPLRRLIPNRLRYSLRVRLSKSFPRWTRTPECVRVRSSPRTCGRLGPEAGDGPGWFGELPSTPPAVGEAFGWDR
jgi:hypothetical protein